MVFAKIYFLTNSPLIKDVICIIDSECFIINKEYYLKRNTNKRNVQKLLIKNEILVPEIIDVKELNKHSFPIMCKSKNHADFIITIYTRGTFNSIISKYDINNLYFEKYIKSNKEIKVYFVRDKIFLYDNEKDFRYIEKLTTIFKKISDVLNLQVFSVDILMSDEKFFVIDVNPAAGLYNSKLSRQYLVEW